MSRFTTAAKFDARAAAIVLAGIIGFGYLTHLILKADSMELGHVTSGGQTSCSQPANLRTHPQLPQPLR